MKTIALSLLLLLVLPAVAVAQDRGVTDEDYRFRIAPPGPGWRVLDEKGIQPLLPDGVAGAMQDGGVFGAVMVEGAPGANLKAMAQLLLDDMPLEGKVTEEFSSLTYCGKSAIRFKVRGSLNGVKFVYQNIIFMNDDHLYQVLSWGLESRVGPRSFDLFTRAFSLLPGEVRGRISERVTLDSHGVGWRVKDGVFESAALRIALRPPGGWRLAVGAELGGMNADAEVGMICEGPEIYLVVISELAVGVDHAIFAEAAVTALGDRDFKESGPPRPMKIAGREVQVRRFSTVSFGGEQAFDIYKCAFFEGDFCIQVAAWCHTAYRDQAEKRLPEALGTIRILSEEEAGTVQEELLAGPDPENRVGAGYCLRRGIYRDFENGFTWRKPRGFWRVTVGDEARAENEDATIIFEEPSLGVQGTVIVEDVGDLDGPAYHRLVLQGMFGEEQAGKTAEKAKQVKVGEVPAFTSMGALHFPGFNMLYRVTTMVVNRRGIQFLIYGVPANMAAVTRQVDEAVAGLDVKLDMTPVVKHGDTVLDLRLGYAFRGPGRGFRYSDLTPAEIQPMASIHHWQKGSTEVVTLGLCALQEGQDGAWFEDFVSRLIMRQLRKRIGVAGKPTRSRIRLGEIEAGFLLWKGTTGSAAVLTCRRDNTFYAVIVGDRGGELSLSAEDLAGRLRILN